MLEKKHVFSVNRNMPYYVVGKKTGVSENKHVFSVNKHAGDSSRTGPAAVPKFTSFVMQVLSGNDAGEKRYENNTKKSNLETHADALQMPKHTFATRIPKCCFLHKQVKKHMLCNTICDSGL